MNMNVFDFSPLFRSTIGFDRLGHLLETALAEGAGNGYPPYNIEKTGENAYRISMAVAGFAPEEISIQVKEDLLTISGKAEKTEENRQFLYRGIAARTFERRFQLADHVQVKGADLTNGLLHIDLQREIPEDKKPRMIKIGAR